MNKFIMVFIATSAISGCADPKALTAFCQIDGIIQPIAVSVASPLSVASGTVAEADAIAKIDAPLHKAIQDYCAQAGGVIVSVPSAPSK